MDLREIRVKIRAADYRFSDHSVKQMIKRSVDRFEIEESVSDGEIIEEYPEDKYSPSCLVYGKTKAGRSLHVQLSFPPAVVVITVYEPNETEWIDYRIRREKP